MNDEPKMEHELQPAKTGSHSRMKTAILVVGVLIISVVMAMTGSK